VWARWGGGGFGRRVGKGGEGRREYGQELDVTKGEKGSEVCWRVGSRRGGR